MRLLPTITVVATQLGYMVGGLVVVESLFRYQGVGSLILTAARGKDFPMMEAGDPDDRRHLRLRYDGGGPALHGA